MVVSKSDGSIHLCGYYKVTVNHFMEIDQCPPAKPSGPVINQVGFEARLSADDPKPRVKEV